MDNIPDQFYLHIKTKAINRFTDTHSSMLCKHDVQDTVGIIHHVSVCIRQTCWQNTQPNAKWYFYLL